MRILLDNCVPRPFQKFIVGHEIETAYKRGWASLANGELLRASALAGFDVLITVDQNLKYQQNLSDLPLSVVMVRSVRIDMDHLSVCGRHLDAALHLIEQAAEQQRRIMVVIGREGVEGD